MVQGARLKGLVILDRLTRDRTKEREVCCYGDSSGLSRVGARRDKGERSIGFFLRLDDGEITPSDGDGKSRLLSRHARARGRE
jgi:hypothetical protein